MTEISLYDTKDARIADIWRYDAYDGEDLLGMYCWTDDSYRFYNKPSPSQLLEIVDACIEYRNRKVNEDKV